MLLKVAEDCILHKTRSRFAISTLCSLAFAMIFVAVVLRVTPACKLANYKFFNESCDRAITSPNLSIDDTNSKLASEIKQLEKIILNKKCSYASLKEPDQENAIKDSELNERLTENELEAWNDKRLDSFAGCWQFSGSAQTFVDVDCKPEDNCPVTPSSDATYCFDERGLGDVKTEISGNYCRAKITAEFGMQAAGPQTLNFTETTNQICPRGTLASDGTAFGNVIARKYECVLSDEKRITCSASNSYSNNQISLVRKNDE